jgi:acyl CoA:acetate/3-ketoacid CoA transferase beta subunit
MKQDEKRFVKKLDFMTTPGYLAGPGERERVGLPRDTGPYRVITQLGVYGFDSQTKRMMLISRHPGVNIEEIKKNCGFDLLVPPVVMDSEIPTGKELRILREIDPGSIVLGRS